MKKLSLLLCCVAVLLSACGSNGSQRSNRGTGNRSSAATATATWTPGPVPLSTAIPTDVPTLAPTATLGVGSSVDVVQDMVCRMGPGQSYYEVNHYFKKDTVLMQGRNETGDWAMIQDAFNTDLLCWIPVAALAPVDWLDGVQVAEYPALPSAPTSITAPRSVCGTSGPPLVVKWSPVVSGGEYQLYRNGDLVSDQSGGSYYDSDLPQPHTPALYTYRLQAVNEYGVSPHSLVVSVSICGKK